MRRRLEARWRREVTEVAGLVRPGGVVAYVTCSPHLDETVAVIADVMRRTPC